MTTVFVTGGSSALGRVVLERLPGDIETVVLQHRHPVRADRKMRAVEGDLLCPGTYASEARRADVVIHAAAVTHARRAQDYFACNRDGTRAVVRAARAGALFVHVSTRALGASGGAYSASKAEAETAVRERDGNWIIVRLPDLYGAGSRRGLDGLIRTARRWRLIPDIAGARVRFNPVSVQEAGAFLAGAAAHPKRVPAVYSLGGPREYTARDLAAAMTHAAGRRVWTVRVPMAVLRAAGWLTRWRLLCPDQVDRLLLARRPATAAAEEDYGFRAQSLEAYLASLG